MIELEKLKHLLNDGVITYNSFKQQVLNLHSQAGNDETERMIEAIKDFDQYVVAKAESKSD